MDVDEINAQCPRTFWPIFNAELIPGLLGKRPILEIAIDEEQMQIMYPDAAEREAVNLRISKAIAAALDEVLAKMDHLPRVARSAYMIRKAMPAE